MADAGEYLGVLLVPRLETGPDGDVGIALAIWITRRRWAAFGGDLALVYDIRRDARSAACADPAGVYGAARFRGLALRP